MTRPPRLQLETRHLSTHALNLVLQLNELQEYSDSRQPAELDIGSLYFMQLLVHAVLTALVS